MSVWCADSNYSTMQRRHDTTTWTEPNRTEPNVTNMHWLMCVLSEWRTDANVTVMCGRGTRTHTTCSRACVPRGGLACVQYITRSPAVHSTDGATNQVWCCAIAACGAFKGRTLWLVHMYLQVYKVDTKRVMLYITVCACTYCRIWQRSAFMLALQRVPVHVACAHVRATCTGWRCGFVLWMWKGIYWLRTYRRCLNDSRAMVHDCQFILQVAALIWYSTSILIWLIRSVKLVFLKTFYNLAAIEFSFTFLLLNSNICRHFLWLFAILWVFVLLGGWLVAPTVYGCH